MMYSPQEIKETVDMFMRHKLDIRAITMGISLRDCAGPSGVESRRRMKEKILRTASRLVSVGREIEDEYGIPIINKRIAVTPISLVAESSDDTDFTPWAITLDEVAEIGRAHV